MDNSDRVPAHDKPLDPELDAAVQKYLRGDGADLEALRDERLKGQLHVREEASQQSAKTAAKDEKGLMPSEGDFEALRIDFEKTWSNYQWDIDGPIGVPSSVFQCDMLLPDFGPYTLDVTPCGSFMAIAGRKGHVAIVDMINGGLIREMQVKETVRDVVFLQNETFYAVAQEKYPYIYNRDGVEVHCLREHGPVLQLELLNNHFYLASLNQSGQLHYQDLRTGQMIGNISTKQGSGCVMEVNPCNGLLAVGHSGGTVTMWNLTSADPLVKMPCHLDPISALAFHPNGNLMATSAGEMKIKIWDLRKFEIVQTIPGRYARSLDFSQTGLLAAGTGPDVQVFSDFSGSQNYTECMCHSIVQEYPIRTVRFLPYDIDLVLGHSMGWSSIPIPGSWKDPPSDPWVWDPYEAAKLRREKEIHSLFDKLPTETIMSDPSRAAA